MSGTTCLSMASFLSVGHAVKMLLPRKAQQGGARRAQRKLEVQNFENLPTLSVSPDLSKRDFGLLPPMPPLLLRHSEKITLVDCGSGSTRALFFQDDGKSHVSWEKSSWRGEALASALQDELRLENLLRLLEQELPDGAVLLGATAGVREAVQDGSLNNSSLQHFRDRVLDCLGPRAQFMVLSGQEEARAEWEALQHSLAFTPGLHAGLFAGMMSGGGMSCQLAVQGDADVALFSFRNGVLAPGGIAEAAGKNLLFARDLPGKLEEVRAVAKWLGLYVAGESTERDLLMGLGYNRWLAHQEVLEAVNCHLGDLKSRFLNDDHPSSEPIPRRVAISWTYGIILQEILKHCFETSASFYCLKGINWSTGHYLQHREGLRQSLLQIS
ncbi:PYK [Symbiodinium sp. CCMP2456]|nr:PYK [Symbiodinium sp. CCMP2456]